jgi:hypothetical protein
MFVVKHRAAGEAAAHRPIDDGLDRAMGGFSRIWARWRSWALRRAARRFFALAEWALARGDTLLRRSKRAFERSLPVDTLALGAPGEASE